MGKLGKQRMSAAVVYGTGYAGIVTRDALLKSRTPMGEVKVSSLKIVATPLLAKDSGLLEITDKMYGAGVRLLPVVERGRVAGVVCAEDLVQEIKNLQDIRKLRAGDVGSIKPISLKKGATLAQAVSLMQKTGVGRLPVVDSSNKILGIVSLTDIMQNYLLKPVYREGGYRGLPRTKTSIRTKGFEPAKKELLDTPVENQLTANAVTASPDAALAEILQLMKRRNIAAVVLAEKGKLAGIITIRDLLRAILSLKAERRNLQLIGLPELDGPDRAIFEQSLTETYDKLGRIINNEIELTLHVKTHETGGLRRKYSVHCRLNSPGLNISASSAKKWKFLPCAQDALQTLEREVLGKIRKPKWKQA